MKLYAVRYKIGKYYKYDASRSFSCWWVLESEANMFHTQEEACRAGLDGEEDFEIAEYEAKPIGVCYTFNGGRKKKNRRGAEAVEFALILPIFVTIMFGMFNVCRVMTTWNHTICAVNQAARNLAVNDESQPSQAARTASIAAAETTATQMITAQCALIGVVPTVTFVNTLRADNATTDKQITVKIPYNQFSLWPTNSIYKVVCQKTSEQNLGPPVSP